MIELGLGTLGLGTLGLGTAGLTLVLPAAFLGGFLDAIVGGGGLIVLPAMLATYPNLAPATVLGTGKGSSFWGLASASLRYARSVPIPWRLVAPAMLIGACSSAVGAYTVRALPSELLRPLIPFMLAAMLLYTLAHRSLGEHHEPRNLNRRGYWIGAGLMVAIGFYDGFLGPGAGALIMFAIVRYFGFDFLRAGAAAKVLNAASNGGALLFFGFTGHILWPIALAMAVASVLGAQLGARLAIARGSRFVRLIFIVVAGSLIAKTAWDGLRPYFAG